MRLARVAVLIGVGLIALVATLGFAAERVAGSAVASAGEAVTGSATRVQDLDIGWLTGRIVVRGLEIAQPEGFSEPVAIRLGRVAASIDRSTVTSGLVVLDSLVITDVEVIVQQDGPRIGLRAIADRLREAAGADTRSDVRLHIRLLRVGDGRARLVSALGPDQSFTVPGLVLRDVGTAEGRPIRTVAATVLQAVAGRAAVNMDTVEDALGQFRDRFGI